ncbi:hypothetical protein BN1221_02652c [Brenneria goodwinii]|uniref:Uncharacterized protein n=1 Tax=Brenneria goodwinii TaxID=1109412 RepID=A0A0G4JW85_9GAMM|nr:hypothetical protein BN1221_02652c [Brenneria goodwinii]
MPLLPLPAFPPTLLIGADLELSLEQPANPKTTNEQAAI